MLVAVVTHCVLTLFFLLSSDTGSIILWVQSSNITSGSGGRHFDPTKSSTYKSLGVAADQIQYVDGTTVNGIMVQDTVSIMNLTVPESQFELATSIVSQNQNSSEMDGIMGLSFSNPPKSGLIFSKENPAPPTFFENLVSKKLVSSPVFGYYIDDTNENGGITFGGVDQSKYTGSITWLTVSHRLRAFVRGLSLTQGDDKFRRSHPLPRM